MVHHSASSKCTEDSHILSVQKEPALNFLPPSIYILQMILASKFGPFLHPSITYQWYNLTITTFTMKPSHITALMICWDTVVSFYYYAYWLFRTFYRATAIFAYFCHLAMKGLNLYHFHYDTMLHFALLLCWGNCHPLFVSQQCDTVCFLVKMVNTKPFCRQVKPVPHRCQTSESNIQSNVEHTCLD